MKCRQIKCTTRRTAIAATIALWLRPGPSQAEQVFGYIGDGDQDDECKAARARIDTGTVALQGKRTEGSTVAAVQHQFIRPLLTLEINAPYAAPNSGYLDAPRCYGQPLVRAYIHETLHFWQTLSQAFSTNLAITQIGILERFALSGALPQSPDTLTQRFTDRRNNDLSVQSLTEALCRYWEIHMIGAPRLLWALGIRSGRDHYAPYTDADFDLLMLLEDAYAAPYRWALSQWGTRPAAALFPLVAHFAMQTSRPVEVFLAVTGDSELRQAAITLPTKSIHEMWHALVDRVHSRCEAASISQTGARLTSGWDVIEGTKLASLPLWRDQLRMLRAARKVLRPEAIELAFALPGERSSRSLLTSFFIPPLILLRDGYWFPNSREPEGIAESNADLAKSRVVEYRRMIEAVELGSRISMKPTS